MKPKKYPKEFKSYIHNLVKHLKKEFFIDQWDLNIGFILEVEDNKKSVAATISSDHVYMNAAINIMPRLFESWNNKDYYELNECILHEFCHLIVDPLYLIAKKAVTDESHGYVNDIRENQTQKMTNILFLRMPELKKKYVPKKLRRK